MPEARLFGLARSLRMPAHLEQDPIESVDPPVAKVRTCVWEQAAACLDEMGQRERFDRASLQSTETPSFPSPVTTTRSRPLIPNRPDVPGRCPRCPPGNGWPDCLKTRSLPPRPLVSDCGWPGSCPRHGATAWPAVRQLPPPLLHGQSPQTLCGRVFVPGVDQGNLRPKIWLSSCVWAYSRHSPSAARGSGSPKTTSAGSRGCRFAVHALAPAGDAHDTVVGGAA